MFDNSKLLQICLNKMKIVLSISSSASNSAADSIAEGLRDTVSDGERLR
jgi:hypothetical protein